MAASCFQKLLNSTWSAARRDQTFAKHALQRLEASRRKRHDKGAKVPWGWALKAWLMRQKYAKTKGAKDGL